MLSLIGKSGDNRRVNGYLIIQGEIDVRIGRERLNRELDFCVVAMVRYQIMHSWRAKMAKDFGYLFIDWLGRGSMLQLQFIQVRQSKKGLLRCTNFKEKRLNI